MDVPLRPPSLFTLKLHGTMQPAHNLSFDTHVPRYAALVMLHGVQFSAVPPPRHQYGDRNHDLTEIYLAF